MNNYHTLSTVIVDLSDMAKNLLMIMNLILKVFRLYD